MARPLRITGKDAKITFNGITKGFKSIVVTLTGSKYTANASDTRVLQRGTGVLDAKIVLVLWNSGDADAATYGDVAALVQSKAAPEAIDWTDDEGSPESYLPPDFWDDFPLENWRVDEVSGGTAGPEDPSDITATLTPNNIDG